jgi:1-acyl-sn-glycerol-3-phosphate acyltransferase
MRSREPVAVKRENPREDLQVVMSQGREKLAKGASIIIFPQSTRSAVFRPAAFNSLGIKLAKTAGVPAMPVAVKTDFWENGKYLKDLGAINRSRHIHMAFGSPFSIQGSGKDEHQQVINFIVNHLREWGGMIDTKTS